MTWSTLRLLAYLLVIAGVFELAVLEEHIQLGRVGRGARVVLAAALVLLAS